MAATGGKAVKVERKTGEKQPRICYISGLLVRLYEGLSEVVGDEAHSVYFSSKLIMYFLKLKLLKYFMLRLKCRCKECVEYEE